MDNQTTLQPLPNWDLRETLRTFEEGTFHGVIGGVEIQKCDDDLDRYREIIEISQPDIVIETGTRAGGSALWFQREMGLQVISIDIAPEFTRGVPYSGPGIQWITSSSINLDSRNSEIVATMTRGKRVMVTLDSDHHSPHVQAEMSIWGPWVTPGCYMVVEDSCFDLFHRAGMSDRARVGGHMIPEIGGDLDAIEKSGISMSSMWERDEHVEARTRISHSPVGWWRKND